jgi:hypothetical protein
VKGNQVKRKLLAVLFVVAMPFTMAAECEGGNGTVAPKVGTVVRIEHGSKACADSPTHTTAVTYQPDGVDRHGSRWPHGLICATPAVAANLTVGGRVQG